MDYDFSRLSTRSFEQLVQALAAAVIGPGIVIFGDGPDGGREATFNGRVNFPSEAEQWQGYGVVQAKFRQRPEGGGKDGEWALKELKEELKKFTDGERQLHRPDYYLFATNVVLTPVAESGGKDRLTEYLESQKDNLDLKDFRVWDFDQLRALLEVHIGVRTAYLAWITSGDVLAAVLEAMKPKQMDFRAVMRSYVQKELCADQYVKLGQAGHNPNDNIPLARVFVDLPVGHPQQPQGTIALLQELAAQRLDPISLKGTLPISEEDGNKPEPGRIVFIGGPGQGKSTLSQFLCQLHRVALLKSEDQSLLIPEAQQASKLICQQCDEESLSLPLMPRFPVRIELNHFAAQLAEDKAYSLFDYVLQRIRQRAERILNGEDLREWLAAYPWLLVLDGLDEVPASSNRGAVLEAVQNFLIDARGSNADLLLVATTRPQGYSDEFSPSYYRHATLLPLDVPRALHYAHRLITQRWGNDQDKVDKLMERMQRAGSGDATAKLMQSPLQVTIMALLVETIGQPPKERWRLFNEYYQVIFRRERERDIPAAELLNSYQTDIDTIHQRVGLRLQSVSERAGGTEALLSKDEFAEIIWQRLQDEGHEGVEGEELKQAIIGAALDRLVFLVPPQEGKIGFEIRSLQEFMAAQWLMNGSDEAIKQRLRAIAPAAHWRNVFLFAAGRCFYDKQHLRGEIHFLCAQLNEGEGAAEVGDLEKAILAGSRLALDLLEDGALTRQPQQLKSYSRLALRLLKLPPCPEQVRLANIYVPDLQEIYREEIQNRLQDGIPERRLGAWRVLLQLVYQGEVWAKDLAKEHWPTIPIQAIHIIKACEGVELADWVLERWAEIIPQLPPSETHLKNNASWSRIAIETLRPELPVWLGRMIYLLQRDEDTNVEIRFDSAKRYSFRIPFIQGEKSEVIHVSETDSIIHREWIWLNKALQFNENYSEMDLADLLAELETWSLEARKSLNFFTHNLPWPIAACIVMSNQRDNLDAIIQAARLGEMGDTNCWLEAENRWRTEGISIQDYSANFGKLPFDQLINIRGFPLFGMGGRISLSGEKFITTAVDLFNAWRQLPNLEAKNYLASQIIFAASCAGDHNEVWDGLAWADIEKLVRENTWLRLYFGFLSAIPEDCWEKSEAVEILNFMGDQPLGYYKQRMMPRINELIDKLVVSHPNKLGLLRLLSIGCMQGFKPIYCKVKIDQITELKFRAAGIIVKIAQVDWDDAEAIKLSGILSNLGELRDEYIVNVITLIEKHEIKGRSLEVFLTKLYSLLPLTAWEPRKAVLRVMQEQQKRRLSDSNVLRLEN